MNQRFYTVELRHNERKGEIYEADIWALDAMSAWNLVESKLQDIYTVVAVHIDGGLWEG